MSSPNSPIPAQTPSTDKPVIPQPPSTDASGVDRFFASLAVGIGSIILALILAGIGINTLQEQTSACSASISSCAGQSSCYNTGFWPFFLAAFAVAGGGLKMASRIGKK